MCLVLTIQAPEIARRMLEATARLLPWSALRLCVEPLPRRPWAKLTSVRGTISEGGGCACSLLADDADWDAPFWSMRSEVLEPLAQTLGAVGTTMPDGFAFAALWVGDAPARERVVSLARIIHES